MGSTWGDEFESPPHRIVVKPFFIDTHEVTCDEYQKFIAATEYPTPPGWINGQYPTGTARRPVTGVNWDDANAYAKWAGKRLPSEAEWEFAARGTEGRRYPWGNEWRPGFSNADSTSLGRMSDVGAYSAGASPFGLFDMVGNAWEWTSSDFIAYPGSNVSVQSSEDNKVIRGGCYLSKKTQATATYRFSWSARNAEGYENTSFRCVKDIEVSSAARH
jgi:serine/threonine-protein kinase